MPSPFWHDVTMEPEKKSTSFSESGLVVSDSVIDVVVDRTPETPPAPKLPKKGVYVLQKGDTPGLVSQKLFGRGNRAVDLVRANPDVVWDVGSEITIP